MARCQLTAAQIDDVLGNFAASSEWTEMDVTPAKMLPPPRPSKRRCESDADALEAVRKYLSVGRWNDLLPTGRDTLDADVADKRFAYAARVLGFPEAAPRAAKKQKIATCALAAVDSNVKPPPVPPTPVPARAIAVPAAAAPINSTTRPAAPFSPAATAAAVVDFFTPVPVPSPTALKHPAAAPAADQPRRSARAPRAFVQFHHASAMLMLPRVVQPC